jgi:hypothetical protein
VGLGFAAGRGQVLQRGADVEGDVVEAGHALGLRRRALGARQLAGQIVVMRAGREEHDAAVLAGVRLGESEQIAVKTARGLEVAHVERDVAQLADFHAPVV